MKFESERRNHGNNVGMSAEKEGKVEGGCEVSSKRKKGERKKGKIEKEK